MFRIDLYFLLLATVLLVVGVLIGIFMAASHNYQLAPVHAHVNLVGWASLALYGLVYRAYPMLQARALAKWHFASASVAAVLMGPGIALAVLYQIEWLATLSAFIWLIGAALFLMQLLSLLSVRENFESSGPGVR
jgi:hypothetical protein